MSGAEAKRQKWLCKQRNGHILRDWDEGVCVQYVGLCSPSSVSPENGPPMGGDMRPLSRLWLSEPPLPGLELGLCEHLSFSGCDGHDDAVTLVSEAFEFRREVHGPRMARRPALVVS